MLQFPSLVSVSPCKNLETEELRLLELTTWVGGGCQHTPCTPSPSNPAPILSWEPGHPNTKGALNSQSRFVFPDLGECGFLVGSGTHGCAHIFCGNFSFSTKGQELLLKLSHPITSSRKHSAAPGLGPAQPLSLQSPLAAVSLLNPVQLEPVAYCGYWVGALTCKGQD